MSQLEQNQVTNTKTSASVKQSACRLGFWTAILIAVTAASALVIATTTAPARSGPNCPPLVKLGIVESCVEYPYTDVADFVPIEYIWMYPALLMALLFVVLVTCIHYYAADDKKIFTHIGLSFALLSAAVHTINYFIQLAVMQPSLLKGELQGLSLFSQYNPHGVFIALEDVGYLMMGVAFLFVALAFGRRKRLENVIRYIFIISSVLAVGSLIVLALLYRSDLEYRYEVVVIVIDWITLIVSVALLSLFFKRADQALSKEEANRIGCISR
ncbi:hypothetical protein [Archaeoglobus sp.]